MHSANISKREKKRRARENPNRFNFRYGDNAKWLQCKEGRLRGEKLLPQGGMKLPTALRLLFVIYRVLVTWGACPMGTHPKLRSLGHQQLGGGQWELRGCRTGLVMKLCGFIKSFLVLENASSDGKWSGSFSVGGVKDSPGGPSNSLCKCAAWECCVKTKPQTCLSKKGPREMLWMFNLVLQQSCWCIQAGEQLWLIQLILILDQLFISILSSFLGCPSPTTCCLPSSGFQPVDAASPFLQPCQAVPCATNPSTNSRGPALTLPRCCQHLALLQTWHHPGESGTTVAGSAHAALLPCRSESTTAIPTLTSLHLSCLCIMPTAPGSVTDSREAEHSEGIQQLRMKTKNEGSNIGEQNEMKQLSLL